MSIKIERMGEMKTTKPLASHTAVYLGNVAYYVRNRVECIMPKDIRNPSSDIIPAVVVDLDAAAISCKDFQQAFEQFRKKDDVFTDDFVKHAVIIVQSPNTPRTDGVISRVVKSAASFLKPKPWSGATLTRTSKKHITGGSGMTIRISQPVKHLLDSWKTTLLVNPEQSSPLPEGPYFIHGQNLHQAWRLYPDDKLAFVSAIIPSDSVEDKYSFQPLHAAVYSGLHPVIAVPSRLYTPRTPSQPIAGLRISVKDIIHLAGVHTTAGSRSYTRLSEAQTTTAEFAKRLIEAGAVIVGKTKTNAHAGGEIHPERYVDYFLPWNPRGDGYQGGPGTRSTSGDESAVASYPWLDVALGTDSTGGTRMAAASCGLWGLRTTWGSTLLDGVLPNAQAFDTIGLLARRPSLIQDVLRVVSAAGDACVLRSISGPTNILGNDYKLLYPTDLFTNVAKTQQVMTNSFVDVFARKLQIPVLRVSFDQSLSKSKGIRWGTLLAYVAQAHNTINYHDSFSSWDQFRADHQARFGEPPYASPHSIKRWDLAKDITQDEYNEAVRQLKVHQQWIFEYALRNNDEDGRKTFMIVPLGKAGPEYRDAEPVEEYGPPPASAGLTLATAFGLPQVVIPIGQSPYTSRFSHKTEYAPVVASMIGPKGSDEALLHLAQMVLEKSGWPVEVLTGQTCFNVGSNERNAEGYRHWGHPLNLIGVPSSYSNEPEPRDGTMTGC